MPGFDGTGPSGQGPIAGRGRGFCAKLFGRAPYDPCYERSILGRIFGAGRGGLPWGGGRGRVFGGGRGSRR